MDLQGFKTGEAWAAKRGVAVDCSAAARGISASVGAQLIAGVAAAFVAAGCSGAGESREETTSRRQSSTAAETAARESLPPARVLATLIAPETLAKPRHRYANLRELRWAGSWRAWRRRIEHASDRLAVIFDGRTPDPVAPRRFMELFGRCAQDVTAFGSIPSTRLLEVVQATAEACERYEIAAAKVAESGGEGRLPPEVYLGLRHIEEADRALDRSIVGLSRETAFVRQSGKARRPSTPRNGGRSSNANSPTNRRHYISRKRSGRRSRQLSMTAP
jgi:hypothetical protein